MILPTASKRIVFLLFTAFLLFSLAVKQNKKVEAGNSSTFAPFAVAGEQARQADSFVDSIGVNIHLHSTDGIYGDYHNVVKPRLQELGVRHVRDGLEPRRADTTPKFKDLYASLNIKSLFITNPLHHTPSEARDYVKNQIGSEKVLGIEGINEPNLFIGGCCWAQTTRDFHRQIFQAFKSDALLMHLPIIAPSLAVFSLQTPAELGDLSAYSDFGNIHNYYSGRHPETNGWGDNGYGSLFWNLNYVAPPVTGEKPVYATETGYHNARTTTSGHRYTSERVEAVYLPRLFLHHFNRGIQRSYTYELFDEGSDPSDIEQNYGLIRHNNTLKPAFTSLKNFIALLSDPGASFVPSHLNYSLSGETENIARTLLQKRDGRFYLVLWVAASRWNPDTASEIAVPSQAVTVTFNGNVNGANVYLPISNGTDAVNSYTNPVQLQLLITDAPMVIELKMGGSHQTPKPTPTVLPTVSPTPVFLPAPNSTKTNVALSANGGTATASSFYNNSYAPSGANNGDRRGANWANGGGWNDASAGSYPDWLQVDFAGSKTIDEINVFTVQDNYQNPVEPNLNSTFSLYGVTNFIVQYWNGSTWLAVPDGVVTNNNKVWTKIAFTPLTTSSVRVVINGTLANYSRITEIEVWGDINSNNGGGSPAPTPTPSATPTVISDGVYRLIAECSGKTLDVNNVSAADGADVIQWTAHGGANQSWRIERQDNGYYRLTAVHSGKVLDVFNESTTNGTKVIQWTLVADAVNQQWHIESVGSGSYKLLPRHAPDKALDVAGASTQNGANVQIWTDNGSTGQRWRLERLAP